MKKTILMLFAAMLLSAPVAHAQKVNQDALLAKIEKSDHDIADAKKGAKSSTWINRGKAFYDAAVAATKDVFIGMDAPMVALAMGKAQAQETATINGMEYNVHVYPYVKLYYSQNKLAMMETTRVVVENACQKAFEAFNKAYEMDARSASKVKDGLLMISNYCKQLGNSEKDLTHYGAAGDAYMMAYHATIHPSVGEANTPDNNELLFFAGYMYTLDGQIAQSIESSKKGAACFESALKNGYVDEKGSIYFYLFHCYYAQRAENKEMLLKGKEALLTGIEKYPNNEDILNGLMQLYTSEKGIGDPKDLIARIEKAIEADPSNIDLWLGRGRVFYALKNLDEGIVSFHKAVELQPERLDALYLLGLFYTLKGDEINQEINTKQYTSLSDPAYAADMERLTKTYLDAVPWLEKAHEVDAKHIETLELLKQLCFRLRDEAGMMDKYKTYNELYKQLKGE